VAENIIGYISSLVINDSYQIGVEIMTYNPITESDDHFNEFQSKVISLDTKASVSVASLL